MENYKESKLYMGVCIEAAYSAEVWEEKVNQIWVL